MEQGQSLTVLSVRHAGVLPFTTQNYTSPSLLHTTTTKKEKNRYSVQVSGSAPCIQSTHTGRWEHPLRACAKASCACCPTCAQSHKRAQASTAPFPVSFKRNTSGAAVSQNPTGSAIKTSFLLYL